MKLYKMVLDNFKGIRHLELDFNGSDANIYGANGTGKTTIFDAFTWLMFGKSSEERSNFSPKTITTDGYAHNLEHGVECEIEINGETVTFKRVYHEVYKKVRGKPEAVLSGHTTDYWINGTPKKEKEYLKYWENIFPSEETVKLLTMPYYFPEQIHWEKRRGLLLEICGDISDADIIQSEPELIELSPMLEKQTVDELKKSIKACKSEINKKLETIPARIDEAAKAIQSAGDFSITDIESELHEIRVQMFESEKERAALLSGGQLAQIRTRIANLKAELSEAKSKYAEKQREQDASSLNFVKEINSELLNTQYDLDNNKRILEQSRRGVTDIENKRQEILSAHRKLQEEYKLRQSEVFDESMTVCDKCGQALPVGKIRELHEAFNERKSSALSELKGQMGALVERGTKEASKEMLAAARQNVYDCEALIKSSEEAAALLNQKLEEAKSAVQKSKLPPFEETPEYSEIMEKIKAAQESESLNVPDTSEIDKEISEYRQQENELMKKKAAAESAEIQRDRIAELEEQEKELGKKFEEAERVLYLCEKFTRAKSKMLNEKINQKFKTVRFQLFKRNITNDGIDDICDVLVPNDIGAMVPFADANRAARLNAGIEIIGVLGEHYGIELPIFVDNAESVTRIIPAGMQIIRLVVSENDKTLRLETV